MAMEYMVSGGGPVFVDPLPRPQRAPHPWAPGPESHVLCTYPAVPTAMRIVRLLRTGQPVRIVWRDYDPEKHALIDRQDVYIALVQARVA